MELFLGSAEQGLIYGLMTIGIFISYRILNVADLTVDGSFTLGAAVSIVFTAAGHPVLGILLAILAGALAGTVTAFLQTKLKIQPILAGILTMTALYTINLAVMGNRPNMSLLYENTIFTKPVEWLGSWGKLATVLAVCAVCVGLISLFLHTRLGLSVRATGDNEDMVRSSSINADVMKFIGLALSNALVALSGALLCQYQQFTDISMGTGMVIIGLASLVIGEVVLGWSKLLLIASVAGTILYRLIYALALQFNVPVMYMKLVTAVFVILAISYPVIVGKAKLLAQKRRTNHAIDQ